MILVVVLGLVGYFFASHTLRGLPGDVTPVEKQDLRRITGKWFEIARFDNDLEVDAGQAQLSVSRGHGQTLDLVLSDSEKQTRWEGQASYDSDEGVATVLTSCFGPLKCGYHLIAVDDAQAQWMMVAGHRFEELWIFSRAQGISRKLLKEIQDKAEAMGYDVANLIVNNRPLPEPTKQAHKPDSGAPGAIVMPAPAPGLNPQTPANEPPVPLILPAVPTVNPAVPKNLPAVPTIMPIPRPGGGF